MEIIIRGEPSDIAKLLDRIRHLDDQEDGDTPPVEIVVRGFAGDAEDDKQDTNEGRG